MGEAKSGVEIVALVASRMGYGLEPRHPSLVMAEIARIVPGYGGISYARLERHGLNTPTSSYVDAGTPILSPDATGLGSLQPVLSGRR
jgi:predicted molibdopterin-dependent oxidoreductase YjgC